MTRHDPLRIGVMAFVLGSALAACSGPTAPASPRHLFSSHDQTSMVTECSPAQLHVTFIGRQLGAGNDFGTFVIRNISSHACRIVHHSAVKPIFGARRGRWISVEFRRALVLSPHGPEPQTGVNLPRGVVEAGLTIVGEYRDGPGPNGLCSRRHEVVPSGWLFRNGSARVLIANGPDEPLNKVPDGAQPYGGGDIQPVETCGHGFWIGSADRWQ